MQEDLEVVRLADVERKLGFTRWSLYRWIRQGKLQAIRFPNGTYGITSNELTRIQEELANKGR